MLLQRQPAILLDSCMFREYDKEKLSGFQCSKCEYILCDADIMLSNCCYVDIGYVENAPKNYLRKSNIILLYINESFSHPYVVRKQLHLYL